jgi:DNA-binding NarL/FixJ family response regulator
MAGRIPVFVFGEDPISQAGVATQLRGRPEVLVVDGTDIDSAEVAVVIVDQMGETCARTVHAVQRGGCPRIVLVVSELDDAGLLVAVETGVSGLLRRREATPERLAAAVTSAASGDGPLAPDLLGRLIAQISRLKRATCCDSLPTDSTPPRSPTSSRTPSARSRTSSTTSRRA